MGVPNCRQGGQECSLQRMPRLASGDQVGLRAEGSGPSVPPPPHPGLLLSCLTPCPTRPSSSETGWVSSLPPFCPHPGSSGDTWVPPAGGNASGASLAPRKTPALPLCPCRQGVMGGRSRGAGLAPLPDHPALSASEGAARGMRERAETVVSRKAAGAPA